MLFNPLHLARIAGPRHLVRRLVRHLVVWALIVALPVHSISGVLQRVLGASHRHTAEVASVDDVGAPAALLRHLVAATVGSGALALIDGDHARTLAHRQSAERQARPDRVQPTFSEADLRMALAASAEPPAWQDPADADARPRPAEHTQPHSHGHTHDHDGFQRHLHDAHDATVVALGDKAGSDTGAPATSADAGAGVFPLPTAIPVLALAPAVSQTAWRRLGTQPWHDHVSGPLERPPQA